MNAQTQTQPISRFQTASNGDLGIGAQPMSFALELAHRGVFASVAGAVLGGVAAIAVTAGVQSLPAGQMIHVLAVIAAGIAFLATVASVRDAIPLRAVLRTLLSGAAGFTAYAALSSQWLLLATAFTLLVAWTLMEWLQEGHGPAVAGLFSGTAILTLVSFAQI